MELGYNVQCSVGCNSRHVPQVRDRELYGDTDTEVKRQIWKDNQSLFGDEVSPLLSQYIKEKENILFDHLNLSNLFFSPSPKVSVFVT
jgi:negative elongation factor B